MSRSAAGRRILVIPSMQKGNGSGHMKRCVLLAEKLSGSGAESFLLAPGDSSEDRYSASDLQALMNHRRKKRPEIISSAGSDGWDLCVFDSRKTDVELFERFCGRAVCVALDEGGRLRDYFDYLIDSLPNLERTHPNIASTGFLPLPKRSGESAADRTFDLARLKVLISFGGEDSGDLTGRLLSMIDDTGIFRPEQLTVIRGPFFSRDDFPEGVTLIDSPADLSGILMKYDLVFTMFGLTCFEALYSFVPVILFNPSDYHRNLSVRSGIPEIGVGTPDISRMEEYLYSPDRLWRSVKNYSSVDKIDLAGFVAGLAGRDCNKCRGCGSLRQKIIYRTAEKSFSRCSECGLVNQLYFGTTEKEYGSEYFFEEYRKQYGRTYLEDFQKIKTDGLQRCRQIGRYKTEGRLLDVGCGYGPFLQAASDSGYDPAGLEISGPAAEYVSGQLEIPVYNIPFENIETEQAEIKGLDVITMWYVIEHMKQLPEVLSLVNRLLDEGGVFALATPNFSGISRRTSMIGFLESNPLDHYTVWSPWSARRMLGRYGFRIRKIRCPSHHPERYFKRPERYRKMYPVFRRLAGLLTGLINRWFLLGDTIEIYAVKTADSGELTT